MLVPFHYAKSRHGQAFEINSRLELGRTSVNVTGDETRRTIREMKGGRRSPRFKGF